MGMLLFVTLHLQEAVGGCRIVLGRAFCLTSPHFDVALSLNLCKAIVSFLAHEKDMKWRLHHHSWPPLLFANTLDQGQNQDWHRGVGSGGLGSGRRKSTDHHGPGWGWGHVQPHPDGRMVLVCGRPRGGLTRIVALSPLVVMQGSSDKKLATLGFHAMRCTGPCMWTRGSSRGASTKPSECLNLQGVPLALLCFTSSTQAV